MLKLDHSEINFLNEEEKIITMLNNWKYFDALKNIDELNNSGFEFTSWFYDYISPVYSKYEWFDVWSTENITSSIYKFINDKNHYREWIWYESVLEIVDSMSRVKNKIHSTLILDLRDVDIANYYNKNIWTIRSLKDLSVLINLLQRFIEVKDKTRTKTIIKLIEKYVSDNEEISHQDEILLNYYNTFLLTWYNKMIEEWDYVNSSLYLKFNKELEEKFDTNYQEAIKMYFSEPYKDFSSHNLFIKKASNEDFAKAYHRLFYQYIHSKSLVNPEFFRLLIMKSLDLLWREEEFFVNFPLIINKSIDKYNSLDENYEEKLNEYLNNKDKYFDKNINFLKENPIDYFEQKLRLKLSQKIKDWIKIISDRYENKEFWFFQLNNQKYSHSFKSEVLEFLFENDYNLAIDYFKRINWKTKVMILVYIINSSREDILEANNSILDYFFKDKWEIKEFSNKKRWYNILRDQEIFSILEEKLLNDDSFLDAFQLQLEKYRWTKIIRTIKDSKKAMQLLSESTIFKLWDLSPRLWAKKVLKELEKWDPETAFMAAYKMFDF